MSDREAAPAGVLFLRRPARVMVTGNSTRNSWRADVMPFIGVSGTRLGLLGSCELAISVGRWASVAMRSPERVLPGQVPRARLLLLAVCLSGVGRLHGSRRSVATGSLAVQVSARCVASRQRQRRIDNIRLIHSIIGISLPEAACACSASSRAWIRLHAPCSATYSSSQVGKGWFSGMRACRNWGRTYDGLCA